MKAVWELMVSATESSTVLESWFRDYERKHKNKELRARTDSYLRRLVVTPGKWPFPLYRPLGDIGEIRFDLKNIEYRIYGYFGPGSRQFTVIKACSGKQSQQQDISNAKKLKKQMDKINPKLEKYDV